MICHKGTQKIETERLILRKFAIDDADDLYNTCLSDGEVTKFLRMEKQASSDTVCEVLKNWVKKYPEDTYYHWCIENKQTGELMGSIGAHSESEYDMIAQTGYFLGRKFWSKGYATEALKAVIHFMIFEVGYNRVEACHSSNNPASGKVMQKSGMKYEGTIRQGYLCGLGFQDSCLYGILKDDFKD